MNQPIYCSGMGSVTSISNDCNTFAQALFCQKCGIEELTEFQSEHSAVATGALIKSITEDKYEVIAGNAFMEALHDAGLEASEIKNNRRIGLVLGTSLANTLSIESYYQKSGVPEFDQERLNLIQKSFMEYLCDRLCERFRIKGPSFMISNTCVSGITAIALACQLINSGEVDVCFAGGIETIGDLIFSGLDALNALSFRTILEPFSLDRNGMILGEAAGFLVLTNQKSERNYGIVSGWAISNDGVHLSAPDREAGGLVMAIQNSLEMARLKAGNIDCVFCAGTGTKYNDSMQALAISKVWGDGKTPVPVTTIKRLTGHTLGASGIIESIGALIMMKEGQVVPIGAEYETNPEFIGSYLLHELTMMEVKHCMVFGAGFSGINGAVIFGKGAGGM